MCETCKVEASEIPEAPTRRKRLWEIDRQLHCSIVGTCLTLGELRRIGAKLRIKIPPDTAEYDIHNYFVSNAGDGGPDARPARSRRDCAGRVARPAVAA